MVGSFTLTLFRHGITLENERKQYLGWTDVPLNDNGRIQTKNVAKELHGYEPEKIIVSDLRRCEETAEILFPNTLIEKMSDFREMHFGTFEGKTYDRLKDKQTYQDWINAPFDISPEGGESFQVFSDRVLGGMEKIVADVSVNQYNNLALVTHGGVIRLLLLELVTSSYSFFEWKVPNSYGFQLKWETIDSFRRLEKCTSLLVVPSMEKVNG